MDVFEETAKDSLNVLFAAKVEHTEYLALGAISPAALSQGQRPEGR
jgi:hypothetical protein